MMRRFEMSRFVKLALWSGIPVQSPVLYRIRIRERLYPGKILGPLPWARNRRPKKLEQKRKRRK